MPFDITNQSDLTALKSEVLNDPESIGYSTVIGNTEQLRALLNDPANNTTTATVTRPIDEVVIPEVSTVINEAEYTALDPYDKQWVNSFIAQPSTESVALYKAKFLEVFPGGGATRSAVVSLLNRPASRAEELFGINVDISRNDWIKARDRG